MKIFQKQWTATKVKVTTLVNRMEADFVTEENISILNERVDALWAKQKTLHIEIISEANRIEEFAVEENRIMDLFKNVNV